MPHKNPNRVPMSLQVMDDSTAHHEPIHVVGQEETMPLHTIQKTGIYRDKQGNQFFFPAGSTTERDVEFSHERGGKPEARSLPAAPENKAQPAAPKTRSTKKVEV